MAGLLLAIECATSVASVALVRDAELLGEERASETRQHAQTLLPQVDRVLRGAGVELAEIAGFAVSVGPGLFTSLRVGISTVKGLAFGRSVPVAPVSTLAALALPAAAEAEEGARIAALLDARREQLYGGLFEAHGEGLVTLVPEGLYGVRDVVQWLPASCWLAGSGADLHAEALGLGAERRLRAGCVPTARAVARLGAQALARGEGVTAAQVAPRYLREPDASLGAARQT